MSSIHIPFQNCTVLKLLTNLYFQISCYPQNVWKWLNTNILHFITEILLNTNVYNVFQFYFNMNLCYLNARKSGSFKSAEYIIVREFAINSCIITFDNNCQR